MRELYGRARTAVDDGLAEVVPQYERERTQHAAQIAAYGALAETLRPRLN